MSAKYQTVTHLIKQYPSFSRLYEYKQPFVVDNQKTNKPASYGITPVTSELIKFYQKLDSLRRTKTMVSDITLSNQFDMFITFTFNCAPCGQNCKNKPCICDKTCKRFDAEFCKRRMSTWLHNQKKKYGNFHYLIVPEYHKDNKSIHFHALTKGYKGNLRDSGRIKNSRPILNVRSYKAGFSTAVKIDDVAKVSSYIKKYITKDMPEFKGKKRYWCSTGLLRPYKFRNPDISFEEYSTFDKRYEFDNLVISESTVTIQSLINRGYTQWKTTSKTLIQSSRKLTSDLEFHRKQIGLTIFFKSFLRTAGILNYLPVSVQKLKL